MRRTVVVSVPLPAAPTGHFDGPRHLFAVRIYFEDTDLSGVVYHANYLRYMERARSDMLRLAGIDQRREQEAGAGAWAVTELAITYRLPARLDDVLTVESRVTAVRGASVAIAQIIRRDDAVLTDAHITAAFVSPAGRARRQPTGWAMRFRAIMDGSTIPAESPE
jgi:acyl-CoA thioester hydrolase